MSVTLKVAAVTLAILATAASVNAADITGAGSTFVFPILSKWSADYSAKTGVNVNYQSIGSGGGLAQIKAATVDFGASDAPMKPADLQKSGMFIMYNRPKDAARANTAINFFKWAIEDGKKQADGLNYVPLPESLVKQIENYWKAQFVGLKD